MVFSSVVFLLYFLPVFLAIYYFTPRRFKNLVLLLFSILFYSWGAPRFIFVLLGTTVIDFHLVKWMDSIKTVFYRRVLLAVSVSINLGLLFYFKYSNFFIENFNIMLGLVGFTRVEWTKLVLPVGISFYTFETITYVVDVYRRVHKPLHNFWDYQLYIILFPKLIAGPIIRYHEIADQISDREQNYTKENRLTGFYRFTIGLAKKVLIANYLGEFADSIFSLKINEINSLSAWLGVLAYTFQIYFDFSGYSDMAIGLGKMMGFIFPENFNNPYISQSITEFWRRWHMTLGNWMRNYLYIPLGGNRVKTKGRLYFNLWFVFLASGLWHGASWNFIIWGAYHGMFLVVERIALLKLYERIHKFFRVVLTFVIVVVGWVFFRTTNISDAFDYLTKMFSFQFNWHSHFAPEIYFYFPVAIGFAFFTYFLKGQKIQDAIYVHSYSNRLHSFAVPIVIVLFMLSLAFIVAGDFNPFIYFRF